MNKIRILSALMALLLCVSMLLTACGNKNKGENAESDATDEVENNEGEASGENESEKNEGEPSAPAQPQVPTTVKIADIMNKNWMGKKLGVVSSMTQEYKGTYNDKSTQYVLVTNENPNVTDEMPNGDSTKKITRVYNLLTDKLLAEVKDNYTENPVNTNSTVKSYINNYVHVISNKYFAILEIVRDDGAYSYYYNSHFNCTLYGFDADHVKYTLKIYNTEGTIVKTVSNDELETLCNGSTGYFNSVYPKIIKQYAPESDGGETYDKLKLIVKDNKVYREVKGSDPVLVKDFGVSQKPEWNDLSKWGENYLQRDEYLNLSPVVVYDKDFNEIVRYIIPGYADDANVFLLANGNLLVQYSVVLADEATEFDYINSDARYDLVTLLVTKDGAKELKDVNYYIRSVTASAIDENGQKTYADSVENLAFINYISEGKLLDKSVNTHQLVTMSNDAKIVSIVDAGEKITDFPKWYNDDYFQAPSIDGTAAFYNESGEKTINIVMSGNVLIDFAVIAGDGIYNFKNEKVYDLKKNNAVVQGWLSDSSAIIKTTNDFGEVKYFLFANGKATEIADFANTFAADCYMTKKEKGLKDEKTEYTYKFFNAEGKELLSVDSVNDYSATYNKSIYDGGYVVTCDKKLYKLAITK